METARRLPGIRIVMTPPPLAEVLPRMDVAVLVGFAATGPTHKAIPIESAAEYAAIFGDDLALAWNVEQEERIYAYLGPAVRAFFANGGLRCWVIRVALTAPLAQSWREASADTHLSSLGEPASANQFSIPGVLVLSEQADSSVLTIKPALAQARSVGAWSDNVKVSSALTVSGFELRNCQPLVSGIEDRIRFSTGATLQTGDLIELGNVVDFNHSAKTRLYAIISQSLATTDNDASTPLIEAKLCAAFQPIDEDLQQVEGKASVAGVFTELSATLTSSRLSPLQATVVFHNNQRLELSPGQWLQFRPVSQFRTLWLRIDGVGRRSAKTDPNSMEYLVEGLAWFEVTPSLPNPLPTRATLLNLELQVTAGQGKAFRLSDAGLTPRHRNSWWRKLSDDVFYAQSNSETGLQATVGGANEQRRFPLAALDCERNDCAPVAWIPLGVTSLPGAELGPLPQTATALEREGLSCFDERLFLDPELTGLNIDNLIEQANEIRYLSSSPRGLFGIHAALSIGNSGLFNEASLIAVPDALHSGWEKRPDVVAPASQVAQGKSSPAHWLHHRSPCHNNHGLFLEQPDFSQFLDCGTRKLEPPLLLAPSATVASGYFNLTWVSPESGVSYILEESRRADFANAYEIYCGAASEYAVHAQQEGIFYYRLTAISDQENSTSAIQAVVVRDEAWMQVSPEKFADTGEISLLNIHRGLLRLAAASGELFAVLGLPKHYRLAESLAYVKRLRAQPTLQNVSNSRELDFSERRALSYAALYHPWVVRATQASSGITQRICPPDGIACGMLAARANLRGAWIAPANQSLKDVVALTPQIQEDASPLLQNAQINLLRNDPRGFISLSADTLADEIELRPINVRRLLILLRRLALRRGSHYVFEPNDDVLQRAVERGFTFLLTDLFRRGAFAGATPAESFRVVTRGMMNGKADRDNGRFVVEIRVAPSLPLQFLTIRLTQQGECFRVSEGG